MSISILWVNQSSKVAGWKIKNVNWKMLKRKWSAKGYKHQLSSLFIIVISLNTFKMNIDNCAFWNESVMHFYAHIY